MAMIYCKYRRGDKHRKGGERVKGEEYYLKMIRIQMKKASIPRRKEITNPGTESLSSGKSLAYSFFISTF
jgi:hypothetical protein